MAIHWKIPFMTLHSETLLTVNVYDTDYSGEAVVLKGAAQPFETQEDTSDDIFTLVRKQSGYLRIVDDGFAADGVTAFNWRDFIPTTDTDRPVTLTDANNNVLWQGFLQAQNFGAVLFGNPQNREFPVQCSLSVTQGVDINYDQKQLRNFAYLLWKVLDSIPTPCKPQTIVVQGDAVACLSKVIDWRNFVDLNNDNEPEAKHKMFECLEEMCKFWGWTARTHARTLYLVSPDDNSIDTLASFPYTDLVTLAAGVDITPTVSDYSSVTIDGGFADADSKDYQMSGASKATFTPSPNTADTNVVDVFDHLLENEMDEQGWTYGGTLIYDGNYYAKTGDVLSVERLDLTAEASNGGASFNRMKKQNVQEGGYMESFNVIMFRKSYDAGTLYLTMQTNYMHSFSDGFLRILADTYLGPDKWQEGFNAGNKDMIMRLGIGTSRNTAKWWNGREWVSSVTTFRATLGNKKPELFSRYREGTSLNTEETSIILTGTMYGYLFLDFLGSDNIPEYDGQRQFNLKDFRIEFKKNNTVVKTQYPNSGWYEITDKELKETVYKATNGNAIEEDVTIDTIFASEKTMKPGFGVVLNTDGSYFTGMAYVGTDVEHPEQHLADRITDYWATSKRKIEAHLLTHDDTAATPASNITPAHMVSIDGTTLYPISTSHKWRDDEMDVVAMEMVRIIKFADPVVKALCVSNWGGNVVEGEITKGEAAAVTSLNGVFKNKTYITSFNELRFFTGLTSFTSGEFQGCTALQSIMFPSINITTGMFTNLLRDCTSLVKADMSTIKADSYQVYYTFGTSSTTNALTEVTLPGGYYTNAAGGNGGRATFKNCKNLTTLRIDGTADFSGITAFHSSNYANAMFLNCTSLTTIIGTITGISSDLYMAACPLTADSAMVILNGLATVTTQKTLTLSSTTKAALIAAEIDYSAIATAKNWKIE